eukprot:GHVT01035889.1.p2 GENE.GHVT01035889.1~~GHVT01035889.1.p2  ORF type:complete len:185 (-),score=3.32 GHVT01035889.1:717-1271(-)
MQDPQQQAQLLQPVHLPHNLQLAAITAVPIAFLKMFSPGRSETRNFTLCSFTSCLQNGRISSKHGQQFFLRRTQHTQGRHHINRMIINGTPTATLIPMAAASSGFRAPRFSVTLVAVTGVGIVVVPASPAKTSQDCVRITAPSNITFPFILGHEFLNAVAFTTVNVSVLEVFFAVLQPFGSSPG